MIISSIAYNATDWVGPDGVEAGGDVERAAMMFPVATVTRAHLQTKTKSQLVDIAVRYSQLLRLARHDNRQLQDAAASAAAAHRDVKRWEDRFDRVLRLIQPEE